jgi:hypothetical protein
MKERQGVDGTNRSAIDDVLTRGANVREEVALKLTLEAMRESQRALIGLFALPASLALGVAATVSYAAAFVERGFQIFERSLSRIAQDAQALAAGDDRPLFGATPDANEQLAKTARS